MTCMDRSSREIKETGIWAEPTTESLAGRCETGLRRLCRDQRHFNSETSSPNGSNHTGSKSHLLVIEGPRPLLPELLPDSQCDQQIDQGQNLRPGSIEAPSTSPQPPPTGVYPPPAATTSGSLDWLVTQGLVDISCGGVVALQIKNGLGIEVLGGVYENDSRMCFFKGEQRGKVGIYALTPDFDFCRLVARDIVRGTNLILRGGPVCGEGAWRGFGDIYDEGAQDELEEEDEKEVPPYIAIGDDDEIPEGLVYV